MNNFDDFEEEDFDQIEFERISKLRSRELKTAMEKIVSENTDNRHKTVGDTVLVWDSSRLTDVDSGKVEYDTKVHAILANYPSIIIEDGCKYTAEVKTFTGDFSKNLDLKVWNKNLNKVYRTSSEFVKLHNVR